MGAALGSMNGSAVADNMGRKNGLVFIALPLLAGALLCAQAGAFNTLLAGRFLTGIGIGLSSALVPVYISEVVYVVLSVCMCVLLCVYRCQNMCVIMCVGVRIRVLFCVYR